MVQADVVSEDTKRGLSADVVSEGTKFHVASLGMSIVALGTFLVVDWYLPVTSIVSPAAVPLVGVGALCHAWSAPLSAVAGRSFFPEWNFFQPFEGSQIFQLHQALGWTLYGLCLLAISFTVVDLNGGRHPRGETTLIGVVGLVSQLLLSNSFHLFSPAIVKAQRKQKDADHANDLLKRATLLENPRTWASVGLTVISTVLLLWADELIEQSSTVLFGRLAIAGHLCAAFVTHILIGVQKLPDYRVFMPFSGGFAFLLLQSFAWLFVGILANVSLLLPAVLRYGVTSTGKKMAVLGIAAQSLLLVSLLYFHQASRESAIDAFPHTTWFRTLFIRSKGSSAWTASAALLPWSVILLVAIQILGEQVSDTYFGDKNTMSSLAIVVMLSTAPLAHWSGTYMHQTYELWQPFEGGSKYVTAQAVGWTAYSMSLSLWAVYNINASELFTFTDALTGIVPFCFLSSGLLILSVLYYVEKDDEEGKEMLKSAMVKMVEMPKLDLNSKKVSAPPNTSKLERRRSARLRSLSKGRAKTATTASHEQTKNNKRNDDRRNETWSEGKRTDIFLFWHGQTWSNEEYLTFYIACVNQILCIATDMARQDPNRIVSPILFFWNAYFGVLLVPFLVIMAGMKRWENFRIFQPFIGGTMFVAWQALGWTLYSAGFLLHSVLLAIPQDLLSGDRIREWPLIFTLAGIPSLVAHCILIISVAKFVPTSAEAAAAAAATLSKEERTSPPCSPIHSPLRFSKRSKRGSRKNGDNGNDSDDDGGDGDDGDATNRIKGRERASIIAQSVSIVVSFGSFVLLLVSDVLSHPHTNSVFINDESSRPIYVIFAVGCIAAALGSLFTHGVAGVLLHPPQHYSFFQPFEGGVPFIMLQAIGWFLVGCSIIGGLMIVEIGGPTRTPFFGITSVLGVVFFVGQVTLLASLRWWHDDNKKNRERTENIDGTENENENEHGDESSLENRIVLKSAIMSVSLCFGALLLFTFADYALLTYGPEFPTGPLIVCGIAAVCGSVPLSWLLSGSGGHNAGHEFTLFGTFGWAMWSFTVMLGAWTLLNMATMQQLQSSFHDDVISSSATFTSTSGSVPTTTTLPSVDSTGIGATRPSRIASIVGIVAQSLLALGVLKPPAAKQDGTAGVMATSVHYFRAIVRFIGPTTSVLLVLALVLRTYLHSMYAWSVSIFGWNLVAFTVVMSSLVIFPTVASFTVRVWIRRIAVYVWSKYLRLPIGMVVTFIGYWFILPCIRLWLDGPMWLYHYWWFHHGFGHVSQDGLPVRQNCSIERRRRYGTHSHEVLNIYTPIDYNYGENPKNNDENNESSDIGYNGNVRDRGPLIFVHGGGWVAVNREVMGQSITPFVRAGFTVYSIDYPLAPECRFPGPLISVIRACAWVKQHSGLKEVTIVGDSAGGNLTTMAAALLSNPSLMIDLEEYVQYLNISIHEPLSISKWNHPSVKSVVSMYGVVDQKAWRVPYRCISALGDADEIEESWIMWCMWEGTSKVLSFCFDCYAPVVSTHHLQQTTPPRFSQSLTLGDLCEENLVDSYPPTLLICGVGDPLVLANRKVLDLLQKNKCCPYVELLEFPGPHAFHGIPPQWTLDGWRSNSYPTTRAMLLFLTEGDVELPSKTIFQPPDWSLPLVLLAHVVIVIGLVVQLVEIVLQ